MRAAIASVCVLLGVVALASAAPGAKRDEPRAGSSVPAHGWVIVPRADRKESVIFHVPPRTGRAGARLNVAYIAERLVGVPRRIASWGTRAYLATDPEGVGAARLRRVYTINARYEGAWGWSYQPEGRMGVLPSLPADGELVSLVADAGGVTALLWTDSGGAPATPGAWRALHLGGVTASAWEPVALPWDEPGMEAPLRGCSALIVLEGRATLIALRPRGTSATALEGWTRDGGAWGRAIGPDAEALAWTPDAESLVGLDGRIVEVASGAEGVVVHAVWPRPRRSIAVAPTGPDQPTGAMGWAALDRGVLTVLWRSEAHGAEGRGGRSSEAPPGVPGGGVVAARVDAARFKIAEVSTRTGRVLASGRVRHPTPLADRPLHLVALLTAGFMGGLLIFTLRGGEARALPSPFRPGGLVRRCVASATDLALGLVLAGMLWGVRPADVLTVQTLLGSVADAAPIWGALGLAAMHSALAEALVGGSVGKIAVGCRVGVVEMKDGAPVRVRRVGGWSAVVRNLTKWALLPAAVLAVVDPLRRHAADVVAGTVVVDLPDEPSAPGA